MQRSQESSSELSDVVLTQAENALARRFPEPLQFAAALLATVIDTRDALPVPRDGKRTLPAARWVEHWREDGGFVERHGRLVLGHPGANCG
jgi:hypothetical protein